MPVYYASVGLQSFMGLRNNFVEKKYEWIEKWGKQHLYVQWLVCYLYLGRRPNSKV